MTQPGPHPYFNDHHATDWHRSLQEGLGSAAAAGRPVFLHVGRQTCGGSRALVEKVLPKEEISEVLRANFVCVALGADADDPDLVALLPQLPRQEPTPLCVYLAADGRILHSTVGGRPAAVFLRDMTEALAKK